MGEMKRNAEFAGRNYAFFCPQGTLLLKDNLYIQRQGTTAENGGQLIYTIEMAQALAQQGHHIDIYARNYGGEDYDNRTDTIIETMPGYPNVRVIHIPTSAHRVIEKEHFYPHYAEYMANASEILKDQNYDFIVGHYADGMFMATAAEEFMFQKDGRRRTLLGITHSLGTEKTESLITKIKSNPASKDPVNGSIYLTREFSKAVKAYNIEPRLACEVAAIRRMDGMVPVSHAHHKSLFVDYGYPEDPMQVIPGGINQQVFHPLNYSLEEKAAQRQALIDRHIDIIGEDRRELLQNGKIILGFGRMVIAKGIIEAAKSMRNLLQEHPDAVYIYIGGNLPPHSAEESCVYNESLDYAREHGYEDRVIFLGRQDQETINKWLNVSDIYLHAAHLEPFGLAPQEAASTGTPVVMSEHAGACDVLVNNEHALHTDPHNPPDIAKQVGRLLENSLLASRLSRKAVETVQSTCTWSARALSLHRFALEAEQEYLPNRIDSDSVPIEVESDNIHAARNLLFQKPESIVSADVQPFYNEMKNIMQGLLSYRPTHWISKDETEPKVGAYSEIMEFQTFR